MNSWAGGLGDKVPSFCGGNKCFIINVLLSLLMTGRQMVGIGVQFIHFSVVLCLQCLAIQWYNKCNITTWPIDLAAGADLSGILKCLLFSPLYISGNMIFNMGQKISLYCITATHLT